MVMLIVRCCVNGLSRGQRLYCPSIHFILIWSINCENVAPEARNLNKSSDDQLSHWKDENIEQRRKQYQLRCRFKFDSLDNHAFSAHISRLFCRCFTSCQFIQLSRWMRNAAIELFVLCIAHAHTHTGTFSLCRRIPRSVPDHISIFSFRCMRQEGKEGENTISQTKRKSWNGFFVATARNRQQEQNNIIVAYSFNTYSAWSRRSLAKMHFALDLSHRHTSTSAVWSSNFHFNFVIDECTTNVRGRLATRGNISSIISVLCTYAILLHSLCLFFIRSLHVPIETRFNRMHRMIYTEWISLVIWQVSIGNTSSTDFFLMRYYQLKPVQLLRNFFLCTQTQASIRQHDQCKYRK